MNTVVSSMDNRAKNMIKGKLVMANLPIDLQRYIKITHFYRFS